MAALVDWDARKQVNTNYENTFLDYDRTDLGVIAYGYISGSTAVSSWTEFDIPLVYRDTTKTPKMIVIMACSSRYGDYFNGGVGSELWVDDFKLVYDSDVVTQ
jgi:hypothetical protein